MFRNRAMNLLHYRETVNRKRKEFLSYFVIAKTPVNIGFYFFDFFPPFISTRRFSNFSPSISAAALLKPSVAVSGF